MLSRVFPNIAEGVGVSAGVVVEVGELVSVMVDVLVLVCVLPGIDVIWGCFNVVASLIRVTVEMAIFAVVGIAAEVGIAFSTIWEVA